MNFPDLVLELIFKQLDIKSRLQASLVCKKWLDILNSPVHLQDILVHVTRDNSSEFLETFSHVSRTFLAFKFKGICIDEKWKNFLENFQHQFEFLKIQSCSCNQEFESSIQLRCEKLKFLKVSGCSMWKMFSYVPVLKTFNFTGICKLYDKDLLRLDSIIPTSLENLSVNSPICKNEDSKLIYSNYHVYEKNPDPGNLTLFAIRKFIHKRRCSLLSLDLHIPNLPGTVGFILKMKDLHLSRLGLSFGRFHKSYLRQTSLTSLTISQGFALLDEHVDRLCECLPLLREISLFSPKLKRAAETLFKVDRLTKLRLDWCEDIPSESFERAVQRSHFKATRLTYLFLRNCKITSDSIALLLDQLNGNVHTLTLSLCDVTDENVIFISNAFPYLQHLNISFCGGVTHFGISNLSKLKHLKTLVAQ